MFTLYLPHLDWSHPEELPPLTTPALNQILRFAHIQRRALGHAAFCFAALRLTLPAARAYAAPIAHQAGMHSVHITGAHQLAITADEAEQLCTALNQLYGQDGWHFTPHTPHWWCIDLPHQPDWQTPCVLDALGTADGLYRPTGHDGRDWLQKHTEIQMALHHHPINEARREAGQLPINGLWLWHDLPAPAAEIAPAPDCRLIGSNSVYAPSGGLPAPDNWAAWCQTCQQHGVPLAQTALYLDALSLAAENGDRYTYGAQLQAYDTDFFAPMLAALRSGQIDRCVLHTQSATLHLRRSNLWHFWRRTPVFRGRV